VAIVHLDRRYAEDLNTNLTFPVIPFGIVIGIVLIGMFPRSGDL
jgi:hypothetical protein